MSHYVRPFVTRFLKPLFCWRRRLLLLRYVLEDGTHGCLGVRFEALPNLEKILSKIRLSSF